MTEGIYYALFIMANGRTQFAPTGCVGNEVLATRQATTEKKDSTSGRN
ncbi:MAG: hypothetical protein R3Y09_01095 [Clostridia bacterium]